MNELQFRFKIIKLLSRIKIDLHFSLRARLKLALWITRIVSYFVKFKPIEPIKFERFIEPEENEYSAPE